MQADMTTTMLSDEELLDRIETFCGDHNLRPSSFGRSALGDGSLIANLRAGRSPSLKTVNKVLRFMADYVRTNCDEADQAETGNAGETSAHPAPAAVA